MGQLRKMTVAAMAAILIVLPACSTEDEYSFQMLQCLETMPWISDSGARTCAKERSCECIWASDYDKSRRGYKCL